MTAPIVVKYDGLGRGIEQAGSAFAGAIQKRREEEKRKTSLSPFERVMKESQDPAQPKLTVTEAYNQALQNGADPASAQSMALMLIQDQQKNAFSTGMDAALNYEGGISSPNGKSAFLQSYAKAGGDFQTVAKFLLEDKSKKGQTVFSKKIDEAKAEAYLSLSQGGGEDQKIYDTLQWMQGNIKEVGMLKGMVNKGPFQSALFSEFENRGNLALAPVIHVFNKAGTLPQKKLNWIKDTFAISPYETQEKIQGRLNAIASLVNIATDYKAKLTDLANKYGDPENIPNNEFLSVSKELNNRVDEIYDQQFKQKLFDKLPDPKDMKGKKIRNPQSGQILISTGKKWKEVK